MIGLNNMNKYNFPIGALILITLVIGIYIGSNSVKKSLHAQNCTIGSSWSICEDKPTEKDIMNIKFFVDEMGINEEAIRKAESNG